MTFDATAAFNTLPDLPPAADVETKTIHPYCRISDLVRAGIAQRQTASSYLNALAAEGLVQKKRVGRENLYINRPLLTLLAAEQQRQAQAR